MYGSKSKYRRRYARRGRSTVARLAKGKTTQVQSLAKAVTKLQRQVRGATPILNYSQIVNTGVTSDYLQVKLSNYSNWSRIFGTDVNDDTGNTMKHLAIGIDTYITLENTLNEPDTTQFTCFLVSLKDEIGGNMNQANGDLSLVSNLHYTIRGGLVMLNKKVFNIHKVKRFVLSNHGASLAVSSAQTQYGVDRRFYWKIKPRKMIKHPYGDWKTSPCATDLSDNYYMLIFNDNSSIDLQNPSCQINIVHTVQSFN